MQEQEGFCKLLQIFQYICNWLSPVKKVEQLTWRRFFRYENAHKADKANCKTDSPTTQVQAKELLSPHILPIMG